MAKRRTRAKSTAPAKPDAQDTIPRSTPRSAKHPGGSAQTHAAPAAPRGKLAVVISLLGRAQGATLTALIEATGWQRHSLRAALSGLRKQGHTIERDATKSGESRYRIASSGRTANPAARV